MQSSLRGARHYYRSELEHNCMGQKVVITGGQGSLAQTICQYFQQQQPSWQIHCPSRQELDVTQQSSLQQYFSEHPCDLLIAAAGMIADQPLAKISATTWDQLMQANLRGAAFAAKFASKSMLKQRQGHVIFITSYSSVQPPLGQVAYASAKAGLDGLTKSLAQEWGSANIRVNAIMPGFLENRMTSAVSTDRRDQVRSSHCLGRFNTEEAVAAFLHTLHTQLPHTSGQIFNLDSRIIP
jgi:3-oxoacyl-[acyl-carrier protein] reductase